MGRSQPISSFTFETINNRKNILKDNYLLKDNFKNILKDNYLLKYFFYCN